jgi:hypothetical protein
MKKRSLLAMLTVLLLAAMLPGVSVAGDVPNQGNPDKVLWVHNPGDPCCDEAEPGRKVEGDFGPFLIVWSDDPIDMVSIKSGNGAHVLWQHFGYNAYKDKYFAKIKISKDISNYVVWTCDEVLV